MTYAQGVAIPLLKPTIGGGTPTSYSIVPNLPNGMSLDSSTGIISGTPSGTSSLTSYTVTASNLTGNTTTTISLAVVTAPSPPTLTSLTPTGGTTAGGTSVTLTGTHFNSYTTVTIGGAACASPTITSTTITCTTAAHAAGGADVTVTTLDLAPATLTTGYMYGTLGAPQWIGAVAAGWQWSSSEAAIPLPTFVGGTPSDSQMIGPARSYLSSDGYLYVATPNIGGSFTFSNRVYKFKASTGALIGWIGGVATTPTGGLSGSCASTVNGSHTPGWCTGGTALGGTGDGMFNQPVAAVTDPSGTYLYVADMGNHRVQQFNASTGAFIGWTGDVNGSPSGGTSGCAGRLTGTAAAGWCTGGSAQSGSHDGMLNTPEDLAVDNTYVYVMDYGNARVQRFATATGIAAGWLGNVGTTGGTCPAANNFTGGWCSGGSSAGASGTGPGMFLLPGSQTGLSAIAVDSTSHYLYVSDSQSHRIQRFDLTANGASAGWLGRMSGANTCGVANGAYTNGWCSSATGVGQSGSIDGSLDYPGGLAVDASYVYVADTGNNRVQRYNLDGTSPVWLGGVATAGGTCPSSNAFSGGWCSGGGTPGYSGPGLGLFNNLYGVSVNSTSTTLYVSDANNDRVQSFDLTSNGAFAASLVNPPTANPAWASSGQAVPGTGDGMFGPFNFDGPVGIVVDSNNNLYASDVANNRVMKFNASTGAFLGWIGAIGTAGSTATCNSGTVTTGWCKGGTATSGNQDGMFNTPAGLALDSAGTTLYVVDNGNNRVQRFDATTGAFKKWTGGVGSSGGTCTTGPTNGWCSGSGATSAGGSGDGYLNGPTGIAVDANYLYVGDNGNQRIVRFILSSGDYKDWTGKVNTNGGGSTCPASGNYTGGWCTGGNVTATADTGVGGVNDPRNLAVDSAGNLWVAESWVYQVEQFNAASGQGIKTLGLLDFGIAVAVDVTATYLFAADTSDNFSRFVISSGTLAGTIGPWAAGTPPTGGQDSCPAENLSAYPTRWCTGAGQTWSFFQDTDLYGIGGAAVDPAGHYLYYTNRGSFGVVRVPIDQ